MMTQTKAPISMVSGSTFTAQDRVVHRGQLLSPTDPIVLAHPGFFYPFGTPESEMIDTAWKALEDRRHEREMERRAEVERLFRLDCERNPIRIAAPELVKATQDLYVRLYGRPALVRKGSVVPADHEVIDQAPGMWRPA